MEKNINEYPIPTFEAFCEMLGVKHWQGPFTAEQIGHIQQVWQDEPPKGCTGKCKLNVASCLGILFCEGCGWNDEDHFPSL